MGGIGSPRMVSRWPGRHARGALDGAPPRLFLPVVTAVVSKAEGYSGPPIIRPIVIRVRIGPVKVRRGRRHVIGIGAGRRRSAISLIQTRIIRRRVPLLGVVRRTMGVVGADRSPRDQ